MNKKVSILMFNLSIIFLFFTEDLMSFWVMMEINLFSFISYSIKKNENNEVILIYFMVQSFSSLLILWCIINSHSFLEKVLVFGLTLKLGLLPFFFWYVFLEKLSWFLLFLVLTMQKIFYFDLMMWGGWNKWLFFFVLASCMITLFNMSQTTVKNIIIISSVFHTSWICLGSFLNKTLMIFYFIIYFIGSYWIFFYILREIFHLTNFKNNLMMNIFIVLSISSVPPFFYFLPKMFIIMNLEKTTILGLIFMFFALINMNIYLRVMMFMLINSKKMGLKNLFLNMISILIPNCICFSLF